MEIQDKIFFRFIIIIHGLDFHPQVHIFQPENLEACRVSDEQKCEPPEGGLVLSIDHHPLFFSNYSAKIQMIYPF